MKYNIFLLLVLIFLYSCEDDDDIDSFEISIPVSVIDVKPGMIEEFVSTSSTVEALKSIVINSETSGKYRLAINPKTKREFSAGDEVKKDQIIIYLDNPELESNTKIESQKLTLDISKQEYGKQKSLYAKGGVTLLELKNSERAYRDAQYNYDNAILQLQKLKITSPFDGVIVDLPYYTKGTKVEANQLMVELMDYHQLYAEVQFPGKELTKIKLNQPIRVTHHNLPGDTLSGNVTQVSPALDSETHSFNAFLLIDNSKKSFRPGMFVKIDAIVARKDSAIVISKDIILSKRKGKTIFVADKGAAFERVIITGLENIDQVEVIDGLKVNDRLIVKGFETLRNKSKVKIIR